MPAHREIVKNFQVRLFQNSVSYRTRERLRKYFSKNIRDRVKKILKKN
jgi:hypothetical protein